MLNCLKQHKEKGQIALILILVMTAALGVGLSVIQRTLSDVSTSSKVEQSSRAFSAAEAGVERALQRVARSSPGTGFLVNETELQNASANVDIKGNIGTDTIELFPAISKEDVAQFWFADPTTLASVYSAPSFRVYFGNFGNVSDQPAIEVNIITKDSTGKYLANKYYIDSITRANGFTLTTEPCGGYTSVPTTNPQGGKFLCRMIITGYMANGTPPITPILARIRLLYSKDPQVIALQPIGGSLPPDQVKTITSVGSSGETQRTVRVTTKPNTVPPIFDYVLFSVNDIQK